MATKEDEEALVDPFIISSLGLGLGLGVGFLFITQSRTLKPLSTAIKLADGAIKIPKALQVLHSPSSPQTPIVASKALIKVFKASSRLIPIKSHSRSSQVSATRLKAYIGAINLIRCDQILGLGFVRGGYKLSKSFIRVVEGFVGLQLDSSVKQGIDALGLFVKASAVAREIIRFRKRSNGLRFGRRIHRRLGVLSQHKRLYFDGVCNSKQLSFRRRGVVAAKGLESSSSSTCGSSPFFLQVKGVQLLRWNPPAA